VFRRPDTPLPAALIAQASAIFQEANDNDHVRACADDIRGRLQTLRVQYRLPEDPPIGATQAPVVQAAPMPVEEQIADLRQRQIANEQQVYIPFENACIGVFLLLNDLNAWHHLNAQLNTLKRKQKNRKDEKTNLVASYMATEFGSVKWSTEKGANYIAALCDHTCAVALGAVDAASLAALTSSEEIIQGQQKVH